MSSGPVLVVTNPKDVTADRVLDELYGRGVPAVRFNPGADLRNGEGSLSAHFAASSAISGTIRTRTRELDLANVRSVYWRRPTPFRRPGAVETHDERFVTDQLREGCLGILGSLPGASYVNHPWRNRDAEYKPAQLATASSVGFRIPRTLITSSADKVRRFMSGNPVIYKPLWAVWIEEEGSSPQTLYPSQVGPEEVDERVEECPHLFQELVPKVADIRLAVIGRRFFATRIEIDGVHLDWRQDYSRLSYSAIDVPAHMVSPILAYMQSFGLAFGAFDFALSETGEWIFLECNPNGQWAFVDAPTVAKIAATLAEFLIAPGESRSEGAQRLSFA